MNLLTIYPGAFDILIVVLKVGQQDPHREVALAIERANCDFGLLLAIGSKASHAFENVVAPETGALTASPRKVRYE